MDFKQIQELIKMINKSNIGEVTIEEKGFKLTIKQKEEPAQNVIAAPVHTPMMTAMPQQTSVAPAAQVAAAADKPKAAEQAADNLITIKSPMIGTFYRSSAPGKPAFIEIGDGQISQNGWELVIQFGGKLPGLDGIVVLAFVIP